MPTPEYETLWDLIADKKVCMLTTVDGPALRSRPMVSVADRETGELRFLTRLSAVGRNGFAGRPQVNLTFANPQESTFVSVSGTAEVSEDRALVNEIYGPYAASWFPEGPDGPDIAVLRVVPENAEYWLLPTNMLVQAWEMIKARMGSGRPDLGEHERVDFSAA